MKNQTESSGNEKISKRGIKMPAVMQALRKLTRGLPKFEFTQVNKNSSRTQEVIVHDFIPRTKETEVGRSL